MNTNYIPSLSRVKFSHDAKEIEFLITLFSKPDLTENQLESSFEKFNYILKQYQDQPRFVDPFLENTLKLLIDCIKNHSHNLYVHYIFKYLYTIISLKTHKRISMYFPHEVTDLIPVLTMLENQDIEDKANWQTRYVLLIWLSVIVKIPFPLSRLGNEKELDSKNSINSRLLKLSKVYCNSKDACFSAGLVLLSNFLSRSDATEYDAHQIIVWSLDIVSKDSLNYRPISVIASLLKYSCRKYLNAHISLILKSLLNPDLYTSSADLVRRYVVKSIARTGFLLLSTNGHLVQNCHISHNINITSPDTKNMKYDLDISLVIEDILEHLINSLKDKTIIIRWSAAKGLSRISTSLPPELSDDIIECILNLFTRKQSEIAWHGGCLALAELGRRKLLPQDKLIKIIPIILEALIYDEPRAYGPVGSIIRDAACFVCWSFSRAFEPYSFSSLTYEIIIRLLIVACFDREINCRRAASAAIQEIIGREQHFPGGIEIITITDYFEVSSRTNAYINVSRRVIKCLDCSKIFLDHLIEKKVIHWDEIIRELASKALNNLAENEIIYIVERILPKLFIYFNSDDINILHGTLLTLSEFISAISKYSKSNMFYSNQFPLNQTYSLIQFFQREEKLRLFRNDLIKKGCIILIRNLAGAKIRIPPEILIIWQNFLEDCLTSDNKLIRHYAAETHQKFYSEYFSEFHVDDKQRILNNYIIGLHADNQQKRIGYIKASSFLPLFTIDCRIVEVLDSLVYCATKEEKTQLWADCRQEAVISLIKLYCNLRHENTQLFKSRLKYIYFCLLQGLKDYTVDNRGDIGSWVREASLRALHSLTNLLTFEDDLMELLDEELLTKIIGGIAKQALERLDKLRSLAGDIFISLLNNDLFKTPHLHELRKIFSFKDSSQIDWKVGNETFSMFVRMMSFPPYGRDILSGIIYSIGGMSESLVKSSSSALFSYLQKQENPYLKYFCHNITDIFEEWGSDDKMFLSLLLFLDRLFSSGCLQRIIHEGESEIFKHWLSQLQLKKKKILPTQSQLHLIKIYCHLLQIRDSTIVRESFGQLSIYLCNKFKFIRKTTANILYETFIIHGDDIVISEDEVILILQYLNSTDWENSIVDLREVRNILCELMKCPIPEMHQISKE